MVSESTIIRRQAWLVVLFLVASFETQAAFNGFVPLTYSGQLSYLYGYVDSAGTQSESTSLLMGVNSSGYIWRPWFATTSLALNVGLTSTQSTSSSSDGTTGTGNFSLGVFPRSRFPFTLNYSRTDSRTQQSSDFTNLSGEISYRVTRLSLRQNYRPQKYNQLYNLWFDTTSFEGRSFGSESTAYGLNYRMRVASQSVSVTLSSSSVGVSNSTSKSESDVISVSHVYSPSAETGVSSLASYVEIASAGSVAASIDSQVFSSFYWRPEHRAVGVSGGVRLSESRSEGAKQTVTRSLNTNLGLGYRVTRSLNVNASLSVGTSDNETAQSLSTAQAMSLSYTGRRRQIGGFSYSWSWGGTGSNTTTQTESAGVTTSSDRQNVSTSLGHNLGKSWAVGRSSSLSATFSQAGSASKSSENKITNTTITHGTSTSWSRRGGHGTTYMSARVSDSRSYGVKDTVFNDFSVSFNSDYTFDRLSSMSGNANYQASQGSIEDAVSGKTENGASNVNGGVTYRHSRPFGVYNLTFSSMFQASKRINSAVPSTIMSTSASFRYSLGQLATVLNFRATESAGGNISKSMNFQATRSF